MLRAFSYIDAMRKKSYSSHEEEIINKLDVEKMIKSVEDPIARQIIYDVYYFDYRKVEVAEKLNTHQSTISLREKWAFEDIREEFPFENLTMLH